MDPLKRQKMVVASEQLTNYQIPYWYGGVPFAGEGLTTADSYTFLKMRKNIFSLVFH